MVKQVGGTHYKADYQHWDWAIDVNLGYLESAASKYVSRWWKKGGVADIEKAISYIEKLLLAFSLGKITRRVKRKDLDMKAFLRFVESTEMPREEAEICFAIMEWSDKEHLKRILDLLHKLLEGARAGATPAQPVAATYPQGPSPHALADKPVGGTEPND
jgi:hypothetical protein